nr:hypothetical protein GCM10025730_50410 [Promicromonospora thailandica]
MRGTRRREHHVARPELDRVALLGDQPARARQDDVEAAALEGGEPYAARAGLPHQPRPRPAHSDGTDHLTHQVHTVDANPGVSGHGRVWTRAARAWSVGPPVAGLVR